MNPINCKIDWRTVSTGMTTKITSNLEKFKESGDLFFTCEQPYHFVELKDDEIIVQIQKKVLTLQDTQEYPPIELKNKIRSILKVVLDEIGLEFKEILFTKDWQPFYARINNDNNWKYIGPDELDEIWIELNFSTLLKHYKSESKDKDIYIRIGNTVVKYTQHYLEKAVGLIVLFLYSDKYIPMNAHTNNKIYHSVSKPGFTFMTYYLAKIIGISCGSDYSLNQIYEYFADIQLIPYVPEFFKEDDIELMNTSLFESIIIEIVEDVDKNDDEKKSKEPSQKNESKNKQMNLQKNSGKESGEGEDIITNVIEILNEKISMADKNNKADQIYSDKILKLSDILKYTYDYSEEIWGGEFLVDIDTNITEGGVDISDKEMLIAVISYGVLQVLVEDNISPNILTEIELSLEEKYGIASTFYYASDQESVDKFMSENTELIGG
jgi:hypothetical protein